MRLRGPLPSLNFLRVPKGNGGFEKLPLMVKGDRNTHTTHFSVKRVAELVSERNCSGCVISSPCDISLRQEDFRKKNGTTCRVTQSRVILRLLKEQPSSIRSLR